jgi:hypothetical protein
LVSEKSATLCMYFAFWTRQPRTPAGRRKAGPARHRALGIRCPGKTHTARAKDGVGRFHRNLLRYDAFEQGFVDIIFVISKGLGVRRFVHKPGHYGVLGEVGEGRRVSNVGRVAWGKDTHCTNWVSCPLAGLLERVMQRERFSEHLGNGRSNTFIFR